MYRGIFALICVNEKKNPSHKIVRRVLFLPFQLLSVAVSFTETALKSLTKFLLQLVVITAEESNVPR